MIGKIKFFNRSQRWGIIVPENTRPGNRDTNVFFYEDALDDGVHDSSIAAGAEVEFDLHPNCKKEGEKKAILVKPINVRAYAPVSELRKREPDKGVTAHGD